MKTDWYSKDEVGNRLLREVTTLAEQQATLRVQLLQVGADLEATSWDIKEILDDPNAGGWRGTVKNKKLEKMLCDFMDNRHEMHEKLDRLRELHPRLTIEVK